MKALVAISPVGVYIDATPAFQAYKTGIFGCPTKTTADNLNHAVVVIGYDTNGNWLIKNSWGNGWGIGGLGWVKDSSDCGIKLYVYRFTETTVASWGGKLVVLSVVAVLGLFL